VFVVIAAFIAIVVLIRLWMRRPRIEPEDNAEERWIDRGETSERTSPRRRRGSGSAGEGHRCRRGLPRCSRT
jgi:hypothetical protein